MTEGDRASLRARLAGMRWPERWRTRFAPAPTGHLHLGHAVNAVFVWSIARAFAGSVIVRIEDHDRQRSRAEYETSIRDDLAWLGLTADNADLGMPSRLRQSDDDAGASRYAAALHTLSDAGLTYACRCSRREIAAASATAQELRYPGTCRNALVPEAATPARRLRIAERTISFADLRHGQLHQQPATQCGDMLLRDRLGHWTYQHAVVVDDVQHRVDLIIRGDDLLASTGRQVLLAELLGRSRMPAVLHHPLIVHPDGSKLSKSNRDTGLADLRRAGWSAERVLGHAAWLGGLQGEDRPLHAGELAWLWAA